MAAPKYTDRIKAQELRSASLKIMIEAVKGEGVFGEDFEFRKQLLLRLASNVLPRLNEHTGEDGEAIKTISQINYIFPNGDNSQTRPETTPSVPSA